MEFNGPLFTFHGATSPFSNMYRCDLEYRGLWFSSSEQAYQWVKAEAVNRPDVATEILMTADPFQAKRLAKQLPRGPVNKWRRTQAIKEITDIVRAKFEQCLAFKQLAVEKALYLPVEHTRDVFWGCGVNIYHPSKASHLGGQNHLGRIIREVTWSTMN